jgi:FtsP/CotA-like multicopper oxidase with cupredoxin domain
MTGPLRRSAVLAALLLSGLAAQAAELREPRPLLPTPQPAGACGSGRAAGLVLRESLRTDVGPYAVVLAGYGQGNDPAADRYAPYLLRLDPGGTTRIALRNALPGEAANLHTHGLFTSPRNAPPCDLGDYSLFAGPALGRVDYRIAMPATLPGSAQGSGRASIPYPPGLAWFHAHVHGIARDQVTSGMAGLITVGDPRAILPSALRAVTDVRHLALRDIQLSVPDCPATGFLQDGRRCEPGAALLPGTLRDGAAIPASFDIPGADDPRWDPGLCGDFDPDHPGLAPEGSILGDGFCARPQEGRLRHSVWLFTVNGQWMPDITLRPGRYTLLRVANLSANVTHVLETGEPMRVLTLDGALGGEPAPAGPGVVANRILMLPGARAEILLGGAGAARRLTLRTAGLATARERDDDGELQGDVWPALALARIVVPAQAAPPPPWPRPGPAISRPAELAPIAQPVPLPAVIAEGCSVLPPDTAAHQWRRRIAVDRMRGEEGERFLIGQEVVDQEGRPYVPVPGDDPAIGRSWPPEPWNPPPGSPAGQHAPPDRLICPVRGRGEVWEMVSPGQELHNLHIHQGSFRLARAGDPGAPSGLTPQAAMTDPSGLLGGDLQRPEAASALVWHDSLPIAPRAGSVPGRTFIYLPFAAEVQEGLYPVHCHILEHEDKGMIAAVRVLPPAPAGRAASTPDGDAILAALLDPEGRLPATCLVP